MKGKDLIVLLIAFLYYPMLCFLATAGSTLVYSFNAFTPRSLPYVQPYSTGLRYCPDAWISNKMPMVYRDGQLPVQQDEYFVVGGNRREVSEFDLNWVYANCNLRKQEVY